MASRDRRRTGTNVSRDGMSSRPIYLNVPAGSRSVSRREIWVNPSDSRFGRGRGFWLLRLPGNGELGIPDCALRSRLYCCLVR